MVLPSQVKMLLNKVKPHQPLITHLPLPFINLMSLFRLPLMLLTLHSVWSTFPISLPAVLLRIFQRITGMLSNSPTTYNTAALSAQVKSLEDNETWELVKLPPGEVALGGQWILDQRKGYG